MKFRYYIGLDLLMWGSDFPHSVGTYPHSREFIEELFEDVPEMERHRVLVDNVCDFFGLDQEKELTPHPVRRPGLRSPMKVTLLATGYSTQTLTEIR